MSPLSRDSFPLNRRSPIDEDNDRERDIRQRPPRASGGPFDLKRSAPSDMVEMAVEIEAATAAFLASQEEGGRETLDDVQDLADSIAKTLRERGFLDELETAVDREAATGETFGSLRDAEASPSHPDPRCYECGERLGNSDRAEVYLVRGGDPFLVHADPCYLAHQDKYVLA